MIEISAANVGRRHGCLPEMMVTGIASTAKAKWFGAA